MKKYINSFKGFLFIWKASKVEARKSHRNRVLIFLDMLKCRTKYGFRALDYQIFGFVYTKDWSERLRYYGGLDWANANHYLNNPDDGDFDIRNKIHIYKLLKEDFKRDFVILEEANDQELASFLENNKLGFAKSVSSRGGLGVAKVDLSTLKSVEELRDFCRTSNFDLVEGFIKQHPLVNRIYGESVNTLRVTTVIDTEGKLRFLPFFMRFGMNGMNVDNISSGGIYAQVSREGFITSDAFKEDLTFSDNGGRLYSQHPTSGITFQGYKLPNIELVFDYVERLAFQIPQYRYIGWDIALTEEGVDLIELNTYPGYDSMQCYYQKPAHGGLYDKMVEYTGINFRELSQRHLKV